jgi:integrase/recombinase XerD
MMPQGVSNNMQGKITLMDEQLFLGPWIKRFLLEYVISVKNLSRNTQQSYRDAFRIYLPYAAEKIGKPIDQLRIEDISPESVKEFLQNIESERKNSVITRNQRLAAIHAFAQFVGLNSPEHIEWCRQIRQIPPKKAKKSLLTYLEKSENVK